MIKRLLKNKLMQIFDRLQNSYNSADYIDFDKIKGLNLSESTVILGKPLINIVDGASVRIGNNVTLNSNNFGYHINMHSPLKLMADRKGAVIEIGDDTRIHGTCIHAYSSIIIGKKCLIAANCQIMDGNGHDLSFDNVENRINTKGSVKAVKIEDCVWIGSNSIILPGVTIGRGSVIVAGSVVKDNIPPMVLAGGMPAKPLITAEQILQRSE
jgi:acetyltransferase-like isoleucine patch superfamily enzyme